MLLLGLVSLAFAINRPLVLLGGAGGVAGMAGASPGGGGYVVGRMLIHAWPAPVGLEFSGREGLTTGDLRTFGAIGAFARVSPTGGWYARGGFSHHHEMPWAMAKQYPVGTAIGAAPGIRHRSGLEVGGGGLWDMPADRWVAGIDLSASWFPDAQGPRVYLLLELDVGIAVGKRRTAGRRSEQPPDQHEE